MTYIGVRWRRIRKGRTAQGGERSASLSGKERWRLTRLLGPVRLVVNEEDEEDGRDHASGDDDGMIPGEVVVVLGTEEDEEGSHADEDGAATDEINPPELLAHGLLRTDASRRGVVDVLETGEEGDEEERNLLGAKVSTVEGGR